jgi:hypothetical protein
MQSHEWWAKWQVAMKNEAYQAMLTRANTLFIHSFPVGLTRAACSQ